MPPKKTKAATGSQPVSASQPEPQRPIRASGRKRRHSDASNVSEAPSSSQGGSALEAPPKRKRGRPAASREAEVIDEEEDETIAEKPTCEGQGEVEETIEVNASRHVHFGSDDMAEGNDKSTATNLTPHPRAKMPDKRKTMSPGATTERSAKRIKVSRTSLPSTLSQDPDNDDATLVRELQFTPLRTVLGERVRRLQEQKRKHDENNLDGAVDVEMVNDDTMLVLDSLEELAYPQLPTAPQTPLMRGKVEAEGEGVERRTALLATSEAERKRFHDAIVSLQDQADEATGKLRIWSIEIEALAFAEPGAEPLTVLKSIRESFAHAQDFLETELPGTLPDDASNKDLLEILIANVKEFADRLRTADSEAAEKDALIVDLGNQVNGLLDHLAERQMRTAQLEDQWKQLDVANETKARELEDLEEEFQQLQDDTETLGKDRDHEKLRATELQAEKTELETSLDKLTASLEGYRSEEARLTDLIYKMEQDHQGTVTNMNKEREETVQDLETRLDTETEQRADAVKLAEQRQVAIEELESLKEALEAERNALAQELDDIKAERDAELEAKEVAQANLETKNVEVEDLTDRVDRLETQLEELNEQLHELRQLNETAHKQRVAAETDLDDRNQEIEELKQQLHALGTQANELRQKLFEVQTKNAETVKELENAMSERDAQYQQDMAVEVDRREGAEELAQQRAATILDLETRLEEVEQQMRNMLAEKDERIDQLESAIAEKDAEIQNLQDDMRAAENTYEIQIDQGKETIEDLEGSIAALQETIQEHEETIQVLQQDALEAARLHGFQPEERDAAVVAREHQIETLQNEKVELGHTLQGLERRVESEAEQMLQLQNANNDEIDELKRTILGKQADIEKVNEKAHKADEYYQEVLKANTEQIETLKTDFAAQAETVAAGTQQNDDIKRRFRDYVRRSGECISRLQDQLRNVKAAADEEGNALKAEGEEALEAMETTDEVEEVRSVVSSQAHGVRRVARKSKGRRATRNTDSGVGLDGEVAEETVMEL